MGTAEVGRQLRALRTASGRTVASVALEAGLSVPYVANLENGRGNPTLAALSQLANALGMQLAVSLSAAEDSPGAGPEIRPQVPHSLVRLGRTSRFRQIAELLSERLDIDSRDFTPQLVSTLAMIADTLQRDMSEADWWRLLDALTLIAIYPTSSIE
jgi:transcriptional regulator with XRE-family HTH domain